MALVFYLGSGSPFVWRVWLGLEHKRIPYERKILSFSRGETRTPEYGAINPRHKVPAIVDDGFALYESAAILEYLDERHPREPFLFPRELRERALCRRMIREIDEGLGMATEELAMQLYFRKPESWDLQLIEKNRQRYFEELAFWENVLTGEYLLGSLSAADFTLYPFLAAGRRYDMRKPELALTAARGPRVTAWMERIEALPYYAETYPPHWK